MHPFHTINLAHERIAELQATTARTRLARRARRGGGARSPAPLRPADPVVVKFLATLDERRPAA
jgi:hypothetical protein